MHHQQHAVVAAGFLVLAASPGQLEIAAKQQGVVQLHLTLDQHAFFGPAMAVGGCRRACHHAHQIGAR